MKKILLLLILFFGSISSLSAETNRIVAGNNNAKITTTLSELFDTRVAVMAIVAPGGAFLVLLF